MKTSVQALNAANWDDFETLFGKHGACAGCWCMWWKLPAKEFAAGKGDKNKQGMRQLAESEHSPGLLLYENGVPAGWCALAPREAYPRLESSRTLKRIDEKEVWSVPCFFIAKNFRGKGYSVALLKAAKLFAKKQGAKILEGYPHDLKHTAPAAFIWTGTLNAFLKAGFREVSKAGKSRLIVRSKL